MKPHDAVFCIMLLIFCTCKESAGNNHIEFHRMRYWNLPTGSRIAYVHVPSTDSANAIPLVFVHGGPGAYQVSENLNERPMKWFQRLGQYGFDVYFYDQAGTGLSGRLADPADYTFDRHVADLEAIRNAIGKTPFILIGSSFGASLTANYIAAYPQHVKKALFICPGYMDPSEWTGERPASFQMTPEFIAWVRNNQSAAAIRRYDALDALMRSDLKAAYAMAPDSEMDPLLDEFVNSITPTTVHKKDLVKGKGSQGMGWWAYTMTSRDGICRQTHIRSLLYGNRTPVLIMRGDADYVPEAAARQYESVFPNSTFISVAEAGHLIWLDQPETYAKEIESFLKIRNERTTDE